MEQAVSAAIGVHAKERAVAVAPAKLGHAIEFRVGKRQRAKRNSAVAGAAGEAVEQAVSAAIGVHAKERAVAVAPAALGHAIEFRVGKRQRANRKISIAGSPGEAVEQAEATAVDVHAEERARGAAADAATI